MSNESNTMDNASAF